jgi:hypothetical protein
MNRLRHDRQDPISRASLGWERIHICGCDIMMPDRQMRGIVIFAPFSGAGLAMVPDT